MRIVRPPDQYHKEVVNLFTHPRSKIPTSLNKHSVLPGVRPEKLDHQSEPHTETKVKRKRDDKPKKLSGIPVQSKIPSINKGRKPKPEIVREVDTPRSHVSVGSHPASIYTPDIVEPTKPIKPIPSIGEKAKEAQQKRQKEALKALSKHPPPVANKPVTPRIQTHTPKQLPVTPAKRPSTPIAKPTTTSSSKLSITSGVDSLAEDEESRINEEEGEGGLSAGDQQDLGYDSPKHTPKHPKLSVSEGTDHDRPAKLTQRDSGLADSIEPDTADSRRETPEPQPVTPEPSEEPNPIKLDPVTEETESESPSAPEPTFKPMLEIFNPKSEHLLNSDYIMGKTLGDGNFAIVKNALHKDTGDAVAIKIIDKDKLRVRGGNGKYHPELEKKCNQPIPSPMYPKWSLETPKSFFRLGMKGRGSISGFICMRVKYCEGGHKNRKNWTLSGQELVFLVLIGRCRHKSHNCE
eukprot:sb/3464464/